MRSLGWHVTAVQGPKKTLKPQIQLIPPANAATPHIAWLGSSASSEVLVTTVEILTRNYSFPTSFLNVYKG